MLVPSQRPNPQTSTKTWIARSGSWKKIASGTRSKRTARCWRIPRNIRKPRKRWGICTREWTSPTARRNITESSSICWSNPKTRAKRWPSTTVSFATDLYSSHRNASRVTLSCNKNRIAATKPSSSIQKPRSYSRRRRGKRTHYFAGNGLLCSIRKI